MPRNWSASWCLHLPLRHSCTMPDTKLTGGFWSSSLSFTRLLSLLRKISRFRSQDNRTRCYFWQTWSFIFSRKVKGFSLGYFPSVSKSLERTHSFFTGPKIKFYSPERNTILRNLIKIPGLKFSTLEKHTGLCWISPLPPLLSGKKKVISTWNTHHTFHGSVSKREMDRPLRPRSISSLHGFSVWWQTQRERKKENQSLRNKKKSHEFEVYRAWYSISLWTDVCSWLVPVSSCLRNFVRKQTE